MPASIDTHIAIEGRPLITLPPAMMPCTALAAQNTDAIPMRNEGPICMMAGLSSGLLGWGGSSTWKARLWTV